jgi:hypothetical protein
MLIPNSTGGDMAGIDETSSIDHQKVENDGTIVLLMIEHLDWAEDGEQIDNLRAKIQFYANHLITGAAAAAFPGVPITRARITLISGEMPTAAAIAVLAEARHKLGARNIVVELVVVMAVDHQTHVPVPLELASLAIHALELGVSLRLPNKKPFLPFGVSEDATRARTLSRFVGETFEGALRQGRRVLESDPTRARNALAHDGFMTLDGRRTDGVMLEVWDAASNARFLFGQRYEIAGRVKKRVAAIEGPRFMAVERR